MPLGTEVDLSPGHIVLDGDPVPLHERGTAALPVFSAYVYYVHGRPSQLLLNSCFDFVTISELPLQASHLSLNS